MILAINPYLFIGIGIIVALIAVFFLTYFLNKKTPVPKGCENLRVGEEACGSCLNTDCGLKKKLDLKKIEEDINKEDQEK